MKKLSIFVLMVTGVVGLLCMTMSAKADMKKLDVTQMQDVQGGSTSYADCDTSNPGASRGCLPVEPGSSVVSKIVAKTYWTCNGSHFFWQSCPPASVVAGQYFEGQNSSNFFCGSGNTIGGTRIYSKDIKVPGCIP